jgi:hypothetical protein
MPGSSSTTTIVDFWSVIACVATDGLRTVRAECLEQLEYDRNRAGWEVGLWGRTLLHFGSIGHHSTGAIGHHSIASMLGNP